MRGKECRKKENKGLTMLVTEQESGRFPQEESKEAVASGQRKAAKAGGQPNETAHIHRNGQLQTKPPEWEEG